MDKILSAEEFKNKEYSEVYWDENSAIDFVNEYSTYLLEAFADEVKKNATIEVDWGNDAILSNDIDQLLTKFKEKL